MWKREGSTAKAILINWERGNKAYGKRRSKAGADRPYTRHYAGTGRREHGCRYYHRVWY